MVNTGQETSRPSGGSPMLHALRFVGLLFAAAILLAPAASAAFEVEVLDGTLLEHRTPLQDQGRTFDYTFRFQLADTETLDFGVVAARENPVYDNGDPAFGGWWTEVRAYEEGEEPEDMPQFEATNGLEPVELGRLHDDTPIVFSCASMSPRRRSRRQARGPYTTSCRSMTDGPSSATRPSRSVTSTP